MAKGKLVLIIGPSGVGKSVILTSLRERHPEFHFPKSATTRKRREHEGSDLYRFVTEEEFDTLEEKGKLLEWAVVHGGARYGTLKEEIVPQIEQGKVVVREVDVQGFDHLRSHPYFRGDGAPYRLQSVFILPESEEQLVMHITKRAPMADRELRRRIASMKKELLYAKECDVQVVNAEGRIEETIARVEEVIEG